MFSQKETMASHSSPLASIEGLNAAISALMSFINQILPCTKSCAHGWTMQLGQTCMSEKLGIDLRLCSVAKLTMKPFSYLI